MDFTAPHLGFVIASYALSFVLIAGLTAYVIINDRKLRAEAAQLEASIDRKPS